MGLEAWLTLGVIVALVVVLARDMVQPALAVLAATIVLLLIGLVEPDEAFRGFSSEAPIVVGALLILARAVDVAGVMQPVVAGLFGSARQGRVLLARLLFPIAGMSGFLNNTTLVAMTVPAVLELSQRRGLPPSRFLIPLSYAAVLGGVITAIGTSTNLTVSGLLVESGMPPLDLFELTPVGLPIAIVGCLLMVLVAGRLLPARDSSREAIAAGGRDFTVTMRVAAAGPVDGSTVETAGLRQLQGVFLVEIERGGRRIVPVAPHEPLAGGDLLTFVGRVDQIVDLQRMRGLESAESRHIDELATGGHRFYEVVVGAGGDLVGHTLKEIGFRARYDAAVLAIHRAGQRIDAKLGEVPLRLGDTLLVLGDRAFRDRWRDRLDFLVVASLGGIPPTQPRKAGLVGIIGFALVALTGLGIVPILHASLGAALAIVATRVLTVRQARDAVDLNIVILIAAAFGLGSAVEKSGLGEAIAGLLVGVMEPFGPLGVLAAVLITTMLLTELISNNAAAVIAFPVALATAAATGSDPRPFVIAVALGASLSFLTPIGYQTNLLVYGLGGYRFSDFTRVGLPLNLMTIVLATVLIPLAFPF
ncbi:MAG: SLC13 family permease [Candidatus Limnocylindria bacterium]